MHVAVREDCIPVILSTAESRALFRLAAAAYGTAWLLLVGKFYFWSSFTHPSWYVCMYQHHSWDPLSVTKVMAGAG